MKWSITGGCGFIGTSLIRSLRGRGDATVRVLDDLSVGTREDLARTSAFSEHPCDALPPFASQKHPVALVLGDIRDDRPLRLLAGSADVLVHLAANTGVQPSIEDPRRDCVTNVIGTLNALEAARQAHTPRFVFASSGAPAAGNAPPIHEELAPRPVAPYGASKLAGEAYCSAYFRTFGVETVALRFGNVFGPGSSHKASVVAKFIKAALAGQPIEVYGDGDQTRDFIYIDDLVEALVLSATRPGIGGEIFQIASSAETTINELVAIMVPLLQEAGVPNVKIAHGALPRGDARRIYSDTRKAAQRLGWRPRTDLQEGLRRTIQWFVARKSHQA